MSIYNRASERHPAAPRASTVPICSGTTPPSMPAIGPHRVLIDLMVERRQRGDPRRQLAQKLRLLAGRPGQLDLQRRQPLLLELAGASGDAGTVALEVVGADAKAFENLNYYPSGSVATVGAELWVANVQKPTITRIDPATMKVLGEIAVGPWSVSLAWHEGMDFAVVAQRGSDTLGVVALADDAGPARLVDAIWIGDEPAHVDRPRAPSATPHSVRRTKCSSRRVQLLRRTIPRGPESVRAVEPTVGITT